MVSQTHHEVKTVKEQRSDRASLDLTFAARAPKYDQQTEVVK